MTQDQHSIEGLMALVSEYGQCRWSDGSSGATHLDRMGEKRSREEADDLYKQIESYAAHLQQRPLPVREGTDENLVEPAPPNSLPSWSECALRVDNSEYIAKRVAEGGYGAEADTMLATELHRFIYEYDDADPYRSAWFLHRLELLLNEVRATPSLPVREEPTQDLGNLLARIHRDGGHYIAQHGLAKALEDAEAKVVAWLARDDSEAHTDALYAASPSVQNMGEGETGKDGVDVPLAPSLLQRALDALELVMDEPVGDGVTLRHRIDAELAHGIDYTIRELRAAGVNPSDGTKPKGGA